MYIHAVLIKQMPHMPTHATIHVDYTHNYNYSRSDNYDGAKYASIRKLMITQIIVHVHVQQITCILIQPC